MVCWFYYVQEVQELKAKLRKIDEAVSWVLLIAVFALLIHVVFSTVTAARKGEETFIFGYRPAIVLTGSMEPYMMTNSLVLTKEVTDIEELEVGDVITFHVTNELGKQIRITHRLTGIEDGILSTKGDNNPSGDGIPLTMENVESKVVGVFNQSAYLIAMWQTTSGKVMILSFAGALIMCYVAIKLFFAGKREEKDVTQDLLDDFAQIAENLGKTPRDLFLEDLARHKTALAENASTSISKPENQIREDKVENSDC